MFGNFSRDPAGEDKTLLGFSTSKNVFFRPHILIGNYLAAHTLSDVILPGFRVTDSANSEVCAQD
jgi:hypothetical protein